MVLRQGQLHASRRHVWSGLSERVTVADLGYARVAMLNSDDACIPETFSMATLAGASGTLFSTPFSRALRDVAMGLVQAFPAERGRLETAQLLVVGSSQTAYEALRN